MIQRCTNPKHKSWNRYGGRGIKVCERWLSSFEAFLQDMGEKPEGLTLERRDVDGNYKPNNCCWATWKTQHGNKSTNRRITFNGVAKNIKEWAEELGTSYAAIAYRLNAGWAVEEALMRPFIRGGRNHWDRKEK